MEIQISMENKEALADPQLLKQLASHALNSEEAPPQAELSIALVKKEKMKELNRRYRGENAITDVLSFPLYEKPVSPRGAAKHKDHSGTLFEAKKAGLSSSPRESFLIGEVIISPEVARLQAEEYGHTFEEELSLLLVHGILHLLGYRHDDPQSLELMRKREKTILESFSARR